MDNKLIAEFMELPTEVFKSGKVNYYFREFNSGSWYEEHELSYNVSWDWLMPVIEKCVRTGDDTDKWDSIFNALTTLSIKEVYEEVIEFINEYNNNNGNN